MKLISWNCMGLRNPCKVWALQKLIQLEIINLLILMETRLKDLEIHNVKVKCGFDSCQTMWCNMNDKETTESITLLWNDNLKIITSSFSLNHTGWSILDKEDGQQWFFSRICGFLKEHNKRKMWFLIQQLSLEIGIDVYALGKRRTWKPIKL